MHDTWARHYDFVYDECFGEAFWGLTARTLEVVTGLVPAPSRVLDLGAGTGRLAVPLALFGYRVTAVEGSAGMAAMLRRRAAEAGLVIDVHEADINTIDPMVFSNGRAPSPDAGFDVALAAFTVVNYFVSVENIIDLARRSAACVRPGGYLVFDLASRRLFASARFQSASLTREIDVREIAPSIFRYRDRGRGTHAGERFEYDEVFMFRYWRAGKVLSWFEEAGFDLHADVTSSLSESGSRWLVLQRR